MVGFAALIVVAACSLEVPAETPAATPEPSPVATLAPVELAPSPLLHGESAPAHVIRQGPSPALAGWLSAAFPGGGFWYLGRPAPALGYLGVETFELAAAVETLRTSGYDPKDAKTTDRQNRLILPGLWLQDTHAEGIYEAYRAARIARGNAGYRTPIPEPGLGGLLRAPVEWETLRRPRIGYTLAGIAAGGLAYSIWYRREAPADSPSYWEVARLPLFSVTRPKGQVLGATAVLGSATFYPVGIGEEALFRGVLQTTFDEWLGPNAGIVAGGLVFGAAHFANDPTHPALALAQVGITSTLGMALGWSYVDDGYDLRGGVAFHVWYDVLLGATYFLCDPVHQPFAARIAIPF